MQLRIKYYFLFSWLCLYFASKNIKNAKENFLKFNFHFSRFLFISKSFYFIYNFQSRKRKIDYSLSDINNVRLYFVCISFWLACWKDWKWKWDAKEEWEWINGRWKGDFFTLLICYLKLITAGLLLCDTLIYWQFWIFSADVFSCGIF